MLVFAAPGAAGVLDQPHAFAITLLAFASFCLAASGTYFWNDVLDVEADRSHPTKSNRPIAAGSVSITTGKVMGTVLPTLALLLAGLTGEWRAVLVVALYMAITLSYSVIWKHIAVVDLVAIASGFVLRAAMGAVAVDVPMSSWFVLVTTFGSLFIVTGKRYAEAR
ncbi:MAG: UbiA family prenyltransferase, partial [Ilumatobacter sp.]